MHVDVRRDIAGGETDQAIVFGKGILRRRKSLRTICPARAASCGPAFTSPFSTGLAMTTRSRMFASATFAVFLAASASAQDAKDNPAAKPLNRDVPRHKKFLTIVAKGDAEVIFLGDSITEGWEGAGKTVWAENFTPLKAVNLGIGGDQTGHVIWRITEGKELEPIKPKAAVIMIGTNNMGGHSAEQIAGGVKAIVEELRKQKPDMKILVLGIFPRSPKADDKVRDKIKEANSTISKLDDGKMVFYKDIGEKFEVSREGWLARQEDHARLSAPEHRRL
jgi:lysophospholipase L1-like esterase